ncbi:MAG: hypothetical protein M1812_006129 [Candelaria pacifica]|nr:MAG: hypothetical protein M1812_006129 [Candelaria pacifica]
MTDPISLKWSSQYSVTPISRLSKTLPGDKILLPPSALEQLLSAATVTVPAPETSQSYTSNFDPFNPYSYAAERQARVQFSDRQQQLPHPLTFRLVNSLNNRVVYAGIREFSAEEGEVGLSPFLRQALGLDTVIKEQDGAEDAVLVENVLKEAEISEDNTPKITIHAKQLPKGTYVRIRPLEAGYDPEDWKSLLEQHLRSNFTTLTNGEILTVPGGRGIGGKNEEFRFLIDKLTPEGDSICVVDTDLGVDIEALNEEQARETLKRQVAKLQRAPGTREGSSVGGKLELWEGQQGQVLQGDYVDYEISSWDRSQGLELELGGVSEDEEIDIFVSPRMARQTARPRDDEHVFGDFGSRYPKRIRISSTNVEFEGADALWVSVHHYQPRSNEDSNTAQKVPAQYYLRATSLNNTASISDVPMADDEASSPDEVRCKNCHQWVPKRTMMLHENFCLRNNILCPHCNQVFKKSSPDWKNHWHCPHDTFHGTTPSSKFKHDAIFHTPYPCPNCTYEASNLPTLAHHRTTLCPGKIILCQFCHLLVPQEGDPKQPNAEALLSNLTPHELADGARTTDCHLCNKIVRLRDMTTHLRHHDLERQTRPKPRLCRNVNCSRTLDGVSKNGDTRATTRTNQGTSNEIGLCAICFGPLYVSIYDPSGKALKRRIERRYLTQLLTGCNKSWCQNAYCKSGRKNSSTGTNIEVENIGTKEALPMIKPFVDGFGSLEIPLHFCVDENNSKRRKLAEQLVDDGDKGYEFEWCVAALEAEGGDLEKARGWLRNWAPAGK